MASTKTMLNTSFKEDLSTAFYNNLLTFYCKFDLSKYNVRKIPMTDAKQHLIEASRQPIDIWICKHYNELCEGMLKQDARMCKPTELKERTFNVQLNDRCETKRISVDGRRSWIYVLKDDMKLIYKQENEDEEDNVGFDSFL